MIFNKMSFISILTFASFMFEVSIVGASNINDKALNFNVSCVTPRNGGEESHFSLNIEQNKIWNSTSRSYVYQGTYKVTHEGNIDQMSIINPPNIISRDAAVVFSSVKCFLGTSLYCENEKGEVVLRMTEGSTTIITMTDKNYAERIRQAYRAGAKSFDDDRMAKDWAHKITDSELVPFDYLGDVVRAQFRLGECTRETL
jgi:hypothetical protein